jgi:hypothetical protein
VLATLVTVPKASVNKDDGVVLWEDNIRGTWESLVVYSIAESVYPKSIT